MPDNFGTPFFVQTPENGTTDTTGYFIVDKQGGWHSCRVSSTVDGGQLIHTFPSGSEAFALQFDECPVGHHDALFVFEVEGAEVARLEYGWDVTA